MQEIDIQMHKVYPIDKHFVYGINKQMANN